MLKLIIPAALVLGAMSPYGECAGSLSDAYGIAPQRKALVIVSVASTTPRSGSGTIVLSTISKHITLVKQTPPKGYKYKPYNEVNPGIGYITSKGYVFGTYYNSYYKQTYYGGYTRKCSFFDCSIVVASGYEAISKVLSIPKVLQSTLPMAIVSYDAITYKGTSLSISYVVQPTYVQVFGLSLKVGI